VVDGRGREQQLEKKKNEDGGHAAIWSVDWEVV